MAKYISAAQRRQEQEVYKKIRKSPIYFAKLMWKLEPQPLNERYKQEVYEYIANDEWSKIESKHFNKFIRGEHLTWQQWLILLQVEKAMRNLAPKRISIASGHGIGKSSTMAILVLWYLFSNPLAQVPCTANTGPQLYDVLWKEIAIWCSKMPKAIQTLFEIQTDYVRVNDPKLKDSGKQWFARARTAKKEAPEALAGVHSKYVMAIIDEASGVDDKIFEVMEGSLTEKNILVIMISNPTRTSGYFYESHNKHKQNWQTLTFSSIDSPIPDDGYAKRIEELYGKDGEEYRVRVLGLFPVADSVDTNGYMPLFSKQDITYTANQEMYGPMRLGIDPSGEGRDKTSWGLRSKFKAQIVLEEQVSTAKGIVQRTLGLMEKFGLKAGDIDVDMFGVGAEVVKEFALAGMDVNGINVGETPEDEEDKKMYKNKRAMQYLRLKKWVKQGGEIVNHKGIEDEFMAIRYRRALGESKIQIMSKHDMRKIGLRSPNFVDSLMLTFSQDNEDSVKAITITPAMHARADSRGQRLETHNNSNNRDIYSNLI